MNKLLLLAISLALAGLVGQGVNAQSAPTNLVSAQKQDEQQGGGLGRTRGSRSDKDDDGDAADKRKNDQEKRKPPKDRRDD